MAWGVAQTHASSERRAIENLLRQDFEAFCPFFAHPSKSDVRRTVESPLFPGYVFVRIEVRPPVARTPRFRRSDHEPTRRITPWQCINNTIGVIRLLTDRHQIDPCPLFVPEEKILEIRALSRTVEDPLPAGTVVRVRGRNNPFYDQVGTVEGMDKLMRVTVMMHIFSRDVRVEFVDPSELEVAAD